MDSILQANDVMIISKWVLCFVFLQNSRITFQKSNARLKLHNDLNGSRKPD